MSKLVFSSFILLIWSASASATSYPCNAYCLVTDHSQTINDSPEIAEVKVVRGNTANVLVDLCPSPTDSDLKHSVLALRYNYTNFGYTNLVGDDVQYLIDYVPATQANACVGAADVPLKDN